MWLLAAGPPCQAQTETDRVVPAKDLTIVAGNVLLGAATAGIGRALKGTGVRRAIAKGALGGLTVYAGKVLVSRNSRFTNYFGRTLASAGGSAVLDAAAGRSLFTVVTLPYGPIRVHVKKSGRYHAHVKLDLWTSIVMIEGFRKKAQALDVETSLFAGVPVFEIDSMKPTGVVGGSHLAGVITFRTATAEDHASDSERRKIIGHELVHVVQSDFLFNSYAMPLEAELLKRVPLGRQLHRVVDFGIHVPIWSGINSLVPYRRRPWEREARTLSGT